MTKKKSKPRTKKKTNFQFLLFLFATKKRKAMSTLKVSIEGNIAAGKSTFLDILASEVNILAVPEPVSKWQSVHSTSSGKNLLETFYSDPKRFSYLFQTFAFLSRMQSQMHPLETLAMDATNKRIVKGEHHKKEDVIVFERSVLSDRFCFAENCFETGLMSDIEFEVYKTFHTFLVEEFKMLGLNGIIYLRTTPETCENRLKKRNRSEEKTVSREYLESLHKKHEDWLMKSEGHAVPVLVLECDEEFETDPVKREAMEEQVREFLRKITPVE